MTRKNILIAYAVPRSGHAQVARALLDMCAEDGIGADEWHLFLRHPFATRLCSSLYRAFVRRTPWAYEYFHGNPAYAPLFRMWVRGLVVRSVAGVPVRAARGRWDACIATHFLYAHLLGQANLRHHLDTSVYAVVTDFRAHPYWVHPGVSRYFTASAAAADDLVSHGVPRSRIVCTGLPLRLSSVAVPGRVSACEQLGLEPTRFTALVCGGSYGLFPFQDLFREIFRLGATEFQWLFLTGTNREAAGWLRKNIPSVFSRRMRVVEFQPDISAYVGAADLAVTKAGGVFGYEALSAGVPLVIHEPLPGQEQGNARFLEETGAARIALTPEEAVRFVCRLQVHHEERRMLSEAARRLAKGDAGREILDCVLKEGKGFG